MVGLATGGAFLWLALERVEMPALRTALLAIEWRDLAAAAALYWLALALRVLRWQVLLNQLAPAPLMAVGETLIVGYAVNNVLPARLGEIARAAYARRRLRLGRARVFGSIVVERLLDLGAILACLIGGLSLLDGRAGAPRLPTFELIALNAGIVTGLAVLVLAALRSVNLTRLRLPAPLAAIGNDFRMGLATLNRRSALLAMFLTGLVWLFEVAALALTFAACAVTLDPAQALVVMGAASLSTLVPTAPGYLGTYQLVFVLALGAFGLAASSGIVAATAIQVVLFGSVTAAGGLILALRAVRRAWLPGAAQSSSENGVKSVAASK